MENEVIVVVTAVDAFSHIGRDAPLALIILFHFENIEATHTPTTVGTKKTGSGSADGKTA